MSVTSRSFHVTERSAAVTSGALEGLSLSVMKISTNIVRTSSRPPDVPAMSEVPMDMSVRMQKVRMDVLGGISDDSAPAAEMQP